MIHGVAKSLPVPRDWKRFDYVPYSYFEERGLALPENARVGVRFGKSSLPMIIPVTTELPRFLGYYAAEGTCYPDHITLSFGSHEGGLIADAQRCARAWMTDASVTVVRAHPTAVTVKLYSTILSLVLQFGLGSGGHARTKAVPDLVWNLPPELISEFLDGYIAGDGYRGNGRVIACTVSPSLATGIQYLLALSGRPSSVHREAAGRRAFPGGRTSWCQPPYVVTYYDGGPRTTSPIHRVPLNESGLRLAYSVGAMLLPYTDHRRYSWDQRTSFDIEGAHGSLLRMHNAGGGALRQQVSVLLNYLEGDVSTLPIHSIRIVKSRHSHVYDFSVPGFREVPRRPRSNFPA